MKCANCKEHEATVNWVGINGSMMDYIHGNYSRWCECCALKAQIENIKEQIKRLPELEEQLKNIQCR